MNVFIFQVSSNKKTIFDDETLQNSLNKMIKYLKKFYYSDFESAIYYLSYIFNSLKKESKDFKKMLEKCEKNNKKYYLFEPNNLKNQKIINIVK